MNTPPLVIDLDGTLIHTDLLHESCLGYIKLHPLSIFKLILWLMKGKSYLKEQLAQQVDIDVSKLPYSKAVLNLINQEKNNGRKIILATASHKTYAVKIAEHLNIFDDVLATENNINLSSEKKADKLIELYGEKGFSYAGNSVDDIAVWHKSYSSIIVNAPTHVLSKAKSIGNVTQIIQEKLASYKHIIKVMRLHQWAKNALIFIPLLASHHVLTADILILGLLAFLFFGLCASSVYILNDLLDIEDDRHHTTKHTRPFASGTVSIKTGVLLFPLFLICAFVGAYIFLPFHYLLTLLVYYVITLLYSFSLKRIVIVDVLTLAILYTIRIVAGIFAFQTALTFWILAFSMFIFLSLALVKRYTELIESRNSGNLKKARGRGYYPDDLEMISSLGAAAGYISVMVLALYIQDESTANLYSFPELIWLACPLLLFWISRVWILAHRGMMHDDPVVFAIKDRMSLMIGLLFGLIFWLAI